MTVEDARERVLTSDDVTKETAMTLDDTPRHGDGDRLTPARHRALELGLVFLRIGPAIGLLILIVVIAQLTPAFATSRNVGNLLAQSAVISVLAVGQLLVIVTRGIDLSVGSTLALATVTGALVASSGLSGPLVIVVMLLTGLAVGTVNGVVYVFGRLPHPFIITLATLSIARGLALWLSDGRPIQGMPDSIRFIGGEILFGWLPVSTIVVAAIALGALILTTRLVAGRWIYAVGGNPDAARRIAIPVGATLVAVYALSGLLAGVAGMLTAGRTGAGAPTFGTLAELDAIAAVVIGGASFLGGRGNVGNAIVGALMIAVIRNGMNLMNVDSFFQPMVIGVVIVLAVEADVVRNRLEQRFRLRRALA
jgi:ribose transport system permease protein